jgi:hypothetical protein
MSVHVLFVLEVPMLGADSYGDCLFIDAVFSDSAEQFVTGTVDLDYAGTNGS